MKILELVVVDILNKTLVNLSDLPRRAHIFKQLHASSVEDVKTNRNG